MCNTTQNFCKSQLDQDFTYITHDGRKLIPSEYITKYKTEGDNTVCERWNQCAKYISWTVFESHQVCLNNLDVINYVLDKTIQYDEFVQYNESYTLQKLATMAVYYTNTEMLDWLLQYNVYPSQDDIDLALRHNILSILDWITNHNTKSISYEANVNTAAARGQLDVLIELEKRGILPNQIGANMAVYNEQLHILKWLAQRDIYPKLINTNVSFREPILQWLMMYNII